MYHRLLTLADQPLEISAERIGDDLLVKLIGGDQAHIGVVSFGNSNEAIASKQWPGHQEFHLTEPWLIAIRKLIKGNVVVLAGVHYDDASLETLKLVTTTFDQELISFTTWLKENWEESK